MHINTGNIFRCQLAPRFLISHFSPVALIRPGRELGCSKVEGFYKPAPVTHHRGAQFSTAVGLALHVWYSTALRDTPGGYGPSASTCRLQSS